MAGVQITHEGKFAQSSTSNFKSTNSSFISSLNRYIKMGDHGKDNRDRWHWPLRRKVENEEAMERIRVKKEQEMFEQAVLVCLAKDAEAQYREEARRQELPRPPPLPKKQKKHVHFDDVNAKQSIKY